MCTPNPQTGMQAYCFQYNAKEETKRVLLLVSLTTSPSCDAKHAKRKEKKKRKRIIILIRRIQKVAEDRVNAIK